MPIRLLTVVQEDWVSVFGTVPGFVEIADGQEHPIQRRLWGLRDAPIAEVTKTLDRIRDRVTVPAQMIGTPEFRILFRGHTPEFYRALREVILDWEDGLTFTINFSRYETQKQFSILPFEIHPEEFTSRFEVSPRSWLTAFILFVDQCRVLPTLVHRLADTSDPSCQRLARSFLAWDQALSRGAQTIGEPCAIDNNRGFISPSTQEFRRNVVT